jgi:hypothetical protein
MSKKTNYEDMIININKKKQQEYNSCSSFQELTDYSDNVVIYHNNIVYKDKKKAIEVEKHYLTNHRKNTVHFHKPIFNTIYSDIISCLTTIDYYTNDKEEKTILERVTIKGVNMDELIADLNKNGVNVTKLLEEIDKHNFNVDQVQDYLEKQHVSVVTIMLVLNRNKVTIDKLLQNQYIKNMIKQSSYAWFCGDDKNVDTKSTSKKVTKRVICYAIYKLKPEPIVISINWNQVKI